MRNILIGILLILSAAPAQADGERPIDALQRGFEAGFRVLKDPWLKEAEQKEAQQLKLRIILDQLFDFRVFSKKVLGSNWKNFTAAQRKEFVRLFAEFLGKYYMGKLQEKYKDETLIYVGQEMRSDTRAIVHIKVVWKGAKIPVDLRMIKRRGMWKVYDIEVLGISAVRNYRAQFRSLLSKETPAQVIDRLKQRIEKIGPSDRRGARLEIFDKIHKLGYCTASNTAPKVMQITPVREANGLADIENGNATCWFRAGGKGRNHAG
jgi:phospholipid transport system substrate-binding protein